MTRYLVHPGTGTIIDLDDDCYYVNDAAIPLSDVTEEALTDYAEHIGIRMSDMLARAGIRNAPSVHAILVAFHVHGETVRQAQESLMSMLPTPEAALESWWIAEDERYDESDSDAAVFVPCGMTQAEAFTLLDSTDWVIIGKAGEYDAWSDEDGWQSHAFWNNTEGWTTLKNATRYSTVEMHAFTLPQGAIGWIYTGKDGNK